MHRAVLVLTASCLTIAAVPLSAEVKQAAPDVLWLIFERTVDAPPATVYEAIGQVGRWWDDEHTWSGAASNMTIDLQAGGCFCERWDKGSVEHGHVVLAQPGETLRMYASLGPLQEIGVVGVLTFALKPAPTGTSMVMTYRVTGSASHGLDKLAPIVDSVLASQASRLERFVETGKPLP